MAPVATRDLTSTGQNTVEQHITNDKVEDVVIVGAGPAGLMLAWVTELNNTILSISNRVFKGLHWHDMALRLRSSTIERRKLLLDGLMVFSRRR